MNDVVRKMATVRKITAIDPIPDADAIEVATVDGWKVVVKKGEFKPEDIVIYFEIDSWIPHELAPFLSKGAVPREYNGVPGNRLRTIRLRKQISQGLILPYSAPDGRPEFHLNEDLTEELNIQKWEKEASAQLRGVTRGSFPSFLRKTDQERVQNLRREIEEHKDELFEVTYKLDGTSFTCFHNDGDIGVCSRNLLLRHDDEDNRDNTYVRMFYDSGLHAILPSLGNIAIQGELMGPGIQGNREKLDVVSLFIFDIFSIDEQRYLDAHERISCLRPLLENLHSVYHVPLYDYVTLKSIGNMDEILKYVEGPSYPNINIEREGFVFKSLQSDFTFKAISNKFLLKEKD